MPVTRDSGRRVHAELTLGRGITVGDHAVELLMRRAGLRGVTGRPKFRRGLRPEATAADLVNRQFARAGPDQVWVTDTTEHPTREGRLYCAVVLDACSRRVVGWSIDATPTAALVTLDMRTPVNVAARSAFLGSWPDPCIFPGDKSLWSHGGEV